MKNFLVLYLGRLTLQYPLLSARSLFNQSGHTLICRFEVKFYLLFERSGALSAVVLFLTQLYNSTDHFEQTHAESIVRCAHSERFE